MTGFFKKHGDVLLYLLFGGLTTAANYLVYFPAHYWLHLSAALSNCIAWAVAVAVAFLTNKPFVFKSHNWSKAVVVPELLKFVGSRALSGLLETALLALTVDLLAWNSIVMKLLASVLVVVINYIASKHLVFRKGV